jgi:hypothetical protein
MSGYWVRKRKSGQRITIDGYIEVKVGHIKGGEVSVCVKAPGRKIVAPSKEDDAIERAAWLSMKGSSKCH